MIKEECASAEKSTIETFLDGFLDDKTDSIAYFELLSYLSSCSLWGVMHSLGNLIEIRKQQGYHVVENLLKMAKKGTKFDKHRINEIFLGLGLLVSEIAMECIFNKYGEGKKSKEKYVAQANKLMSMFIEQLKKGSF